MRVRAHVLDRQERRLICGEPMHSEMGLKLCRQRELCRLRAVTLIRFGPKDAYGLRASKPWDAAHTADADSAEPFQPQIWVVPLGGHRKFRSHRQNFGPDRQPDEAPQIVGLALERRSHVSLGLALRQRLTLQVKLKGIADADAVGLIAAVVSGRQAVDAG